jgi:hypothetical protein
MSLTRIVLRLRRQGSTPPRERLGADLSSAILTGRRRHGPVCRDQPALNRVRLCCRHARRTDRSRRWLPYDAASCSAVRGARDDSCRNRPPLRGDNQDRRYADASDLDFADIRGQAGAATHPPDASPEAADAQAVALELGQEEKRQEIGELGGGSETRSKR